MPRNPTAFEVVWRNVWVRAATYTVLILLLLWGLVAFYDEYAFALQVAVLGFIIAYILNPIVDILGRARIGRGFATVIVYIFVTQLFVLGSVLITQVVTELGRFIAAVPSAIELLTLQLGRASEVLERWRERLPAVIADRFGASPAGDDITEQIQTRITGVFDRAADGLATILTNVLDRGPAFLLSGATGIFSTTLQVFLVLVASAYFLYDFPRFTANFKRYVPLRYRALYEDLGAKADRAVGGYLRGQLLIAIVLGLFIYVGLELVGVPLPLAISFFAAIFNLVPYLGPIIGAVPAILLGLTTATPFTTALLAALVFFVANQLEGNLLSPFILSKSTNLHPVTVLIAITAGLGAFGLVGALFAVPVVALTKVILEEYLLRRPAYTGKEPGAGDVHTFPASEKPPLEKPAPKKLES